MEYVNWLTYYISLHVKETVIVNRTKITINILSGIPSEYEHKR